MSPLKEASISNKENSQTFIKVARLIILICRAVYQMCNAKPKPMHEGLFLRLADFLSTRTSDVAEVRYFFFKYPFHEEYTDRAC
jgi:hypothetical protein